jgi:PAS domain S-box-containing protein
VPTAEARIALLEMILASDDETECAERALEWLVAHAGVRHAVCLTVDNDEKRLVGLATVGVPSFDPAAWSVDLDAPGHPLPRALSMAYPGVIASDGFASLLPGAGGEDSLLAVPLRGLEGKQEVPAGLLLVRPPYAVNREVRWLGQILGHKLRRHRSWSAVANAERRLRRERGLLREIIDRIPDPILLTDAEGRLLIANARAELLFAATEEQSEGRQRAIGLNNMLFSSALGQTALESRDAVRRELLLVDPTEGSDLLFELMTHVTGDSREGTWIVAILRNVTDLRRATEEIEENYRRLRAADSDIRAERDRLELIIDSVADPILVTDPSGNLVMMNAPAERLFVATPGASAEEAQRVRANDVNFTSFVSNLFFSTTDLRYRGGVGLTDPKTGTVIPLEAVSGKVLSEHGEVSAVVTILHDRTEALEREQLYERLKRASAELEQKVREATAELVRRNELLQRQALQLEQASAAKSQFLANMSHELRTPLNAIMGYTSLLSHGVNGHLTVRQKENLARVDANARHLLTIISDILDISRIEAGKMPLHLSDVRLPELIAEAIAEAEPIITGSKLQVTTHIVQPLPTVRTDRQKVKQIVLNLLTNALKFTPQGSVRVSCAAVPRTEEIAIAVADTGIGIAPEDHARVFEDFSQADPSATRTYGGAGLGLSICRRLATTLGGRITLASQRGQGSTFTLHLPRRPRRR